MRLKLIAAAFAGMTVLSAPAAQAQAFINVLTGGTSGVYYPLGVAIGKIYGDKIPNVKTQVQATKASVENLILLQNGRGELAFALGDSLKAAWEGDEETETLRESLPSEPICFFNDREYKHGTIVMSDSVRLRCERGLWVPAAPSDPSNP